MKRFSALMILAVMLIGAGQAGRCQDSSKIRVFHQYRVETQLSYNFFTGPDRSSFVTSIDGFGSGILDVFSGRNSIDLIQLGSEKLFISAGAGFAVSKFRLANHLVFAQTDNQRLTWSPDPDTAHQYVNTFFGYGKSKIITTSFYFPVSLNLAMGKNLLLSAGGYLDLNLTARYKMKYLESGNKVKEIIRSREFRKMNPSTTKFGVSASIFHKKLGYGLSASYSFTPFFKAETGPDIHEARISATFGIRDLRDAFNPERR